MNEIEVQNIDNKIKQIRKCMYHNNQEVRPLGKGKV